MGFIGFIFWILVFLTTLVVLCYKEVELRTATISIGIVLLLYTIFGDPGNIILAIDWLLFALLVSFNIPEIRRNYISTQILKFYKAVLPSISQTEKEAIDAGGIWWDGEIFSGNPNWDVLRNNPKPKLTKEEQAFLDGPVEEVCQMTDNWAVNHKDYDLPEEVWDFLKTKGFFSMIIPKKYGGLEFSPLAVATVMSKDNNTKWRIKFHCGCSKFIRTSRAACSIMGHPNKETNYCLSWLVVKKFLVLHLQDPGQDQMPLPCQIQVLCVKVNLKAKKLLV